MKISLNTMNKQTNIFGSERSNLPVKKEVEEILRIFPVARENNHLFARLFLKRRIGPWLSVLSEVKQNELIDTMYEFDSAGRRRRELNDEDKQNAYGE